VGATQLSVTANAIRSEKRAGVNLFFIHTIPFYRVSRSVPLDGICLQSYNTHFILHFGKLIDIYTQKIRSRQNVILVKMTAAEEVSPTAEFFGLLLSFDAEK
jgi:hypothetical protein